MFSNVNLLWGILIAALFLIPLGVTLVYIGMGVWQYVDGRREKDKTKTIRGYNRVFYSLLAAAFVCFPWRWICGALLGWFA